MLDNADIVIIGQGIVGLSAAIAMQQQGYKVTILDSASATKQTIISRVYAINQSSINLFKNLNIWNNIDESCSAAYHKMHIWDSTNNARIDFDSKIVGKNRLGFMLEESVIKKALLKEAKNVGVEIIFDFKVSKVSEEANNISVFDERDNCWQAKLLIVADGARSSTREMLGVEVTTWPYHQQAIVTNVTTEKSHSKTAYQVFQPNGPLAFLPMSDPNQSSIVWSTTKDDANILMELSDEEFAAKLSQGLDNKLGKVKISSKRFQFPLHMRHAKTYSGARWLLMGDAAHTIHPLAGLGLNVGLADLNSWIEETKHPNFNLTSVRALKSYQRKRKHALWTIIALMQGLHVLFTNKSQPVTMLRGLGLSFVNKIMPLKKLIVEHASGTRPGVFNDS
ncbi:MAG: FAD-dependent oxidoreductase [Legionellaceae bacterium]|nr:FAD-dependent oxidoreductase [Legionellaceae bacterium]